MLFLIGAFGALFSAAATCYLLLALWCVARYRPDATAAAATALPAVTILKPLCGVSASG